MYILATSYACYCQSAWSVSTKCNVTTKVLYNSLLNTVMNNELPACISHTVANLKHKISNK